MALTEEQQKLIDLRLKEHSHSRYETDIVLDQNHALKDLVVCANVLRPEKTSALYFAQYLFSNQQLYKDKKVIDLGCGCGIQGIVMAKYGAQQVVLSDISEDAVNNTLENVKKFELENKITVFRGDLFEKISNTVDVITFNHPFFSEEPLKDIPVSRVMLDDGELIHRFLEEAPDYLNSSGVILMPFFHFAGETNNPKIQAPKHGFKVDEVHRIEIDDENIQKGSFSVFELRKV